ncbi:MAG: iron chelate uptake ABC transporter family permease subunit [Phycisphaerae bacterium]|nr:iron chelate uptake ABC transporter family permease subunit [Phycisphaerae bacterium]
MPACLLTPQRLTLRLAVAMAALLAVMVWAMATGSEPVSLARALDQASSPQSPGADYQILVHMRLPRVVVAAVVGAALAGAGVVCQVLLRNPLADPYVLGVSSGAGLGAVLAVVSGLTWSVWGGSATAVFAFAGALLSLGLVLRLGRSVGGLGVTGLVLAAPLAVPLALPPTLPAPILCRLISSAVIGFSASPPSSSSHGNRHNCPGFTRSFFFN